MPPILDNKNPSSRTVLRQLDLYSKPLHPPFKRATATAIVVWCKNDRCDITPASDGAKLKGRLTGAPKVEVRLLEGGLPPKSDPCEAYAQHVFYGIEGEAVGAIAGFVKAGGK